MILETERLYLREMNQFDFESLCKILQDEDTMYAADQIIDIGPRTTEYMAVKL